MEAIKKNLKYFIEQQNSTGILQISHKRTINQLNDRLRNVNDLYSLYNFIEDLSNNIAQHVYEKEVFFKYIRRLLQCVHFMLEKYPFDASRHQYLIDLLSYIEANWKKAFFSSNKETLSMNKDKVVMFKLRLNKDQCMFYSLKAFNCLLQKQFYKMINNQTITIKSLFYLKKKNIVESWTLIYNKMKNIFIQNQEQTHLKIDQLNQFLKHTLFQVNFCLKKSQFQNVYIRFFQISSHIFRLIKKFYSKNIFKQISQFKNILLKGLLIYKQINEDEPSKVNKLSNTINLIQRQFQKRQFKQTKTKFVSFNTIQQEQSVKKQMTPQNINPKAYAVKLAFHLLTNWKKIKNQKIKNQKIKFKKKQKLQLEEIRQKQNLANKIQKKIHLKDVSNFKIRIKGRVHRSNSVGFIKNKESQVLNKIYMRTEIQNIIHKQFKKLDYLTNYRVDQAQNKPVKSSSLRHQSNNQNEERQLKLEQYKEKLNLGRKNIVVSKSIKLYKPEKHNMLLHSQKIGQISSQYQKNAFGRKTLLKL